MTPRTANPPPSTAYGHRGECVSSGTSLPAPSATAKAVRLVRHHARYVRSFARRVRRTASSVSVSRRGALMTRAYERRGAAPRLSPSPPLGALLYEPRTISQVLLSPCCWV